MTINSHQAVRPTYKMEETLNYGLHQPNPKFSMPIRPIRETYLQTDDSNSTPKNYTESSTLYKPASENISQVQYAYLP